jgi:hypothetical protein
MSKYSKAKPGDFCIVVNHRKPGSVGSVYGYIFSFSLCCLLTTATLICPDLPVTDPTNVQLLKGNFE